jgi:O-antigen/teichoic acid export membrane protein
MEAASSRAAQSGLVAGGAAPGGGEPRAMSMFGNSVTLISGKVAGMGLGFLFWLVAARLYTPADVGLAAGSVSAMMLCTQVAMLGIGSAFIARLPSHRDRSESLTNVAFSLVALASLIAGGLFLLLALGFLRELSEVSRAPLFAVAFVATCVMGTAGILLDQVATALRRGDQMLLRNVLFGAVALVALVASSIAGSSGALAVFAPWALAGLLATAFGFAQLRRTLGRYRFRPSVEGALSRELIGVGIPNWGLTLTERAPGLILPVVVTELLSPAANAYWYAVWMMAWVLYIVPIQVGMNMFAELAASPERLTKVLRHGITSSLLIGAVGALALALGGELALSLLGPRYAAAGADPLRILAVAVVPLTFVQAYYSACRARNALREALLLGTVAGALSVVAAAVAASGSGLTGMAVAWLTVQSLAGIWALLRLRTLVRPAESTVNRLPAPPAPPWGRS